MSSNNMKEITDKSARTQNSADFELEYYLFEVLINDRVEQEIHRISEYRQWEKHFQEG